MVHEKAIEWPSPMSLSSVFDKAIRGEAVPGWLYLPSDWRTWNAATPAYVLGYEACGGDAESIEAEAASQGYREVAEDGTLCDIVSVARRVIGSDSFDACLEILVYYFRFDAFPSQPGQPDPPPRPVIQASLDRKFYDRLGSEQLERRCKQLNCHRGAVEHSIFCRVHHFESQMGRTCPFSH